SRPSASSRPASGSAATSRRSRRPSPRWAPTASSRGSSGVVLVGRELGEHVVTRTLDADIAVPAQCELAEGPFWDAVRGRLRWVDILRGQVHALDPATGAHTWFGTGGELGT